MREIDFAKVLIGAVLNEFRPMWAGPMLAGVIFVVAFIAVNVLT